MAGTPDLDDIFGLLPAPADIMAQSRQSREVAVFRPAIVDALARGYSTARLGRDLLAGLVVGVVALPLSIALAIASGAPPAAGLITAIVGGALVSSLGGSRFQIGGPTGAFIVLVFQIIHDHGIEGLAVATLMAGVILILMGFAGLGRVIRYIPYPVTVGFTAGIAVIILTSQIRDFLGLQVDAVPADFVAKMDIFARHLDSVSVPAILVATGSLVLIRVWPRITRKVPGSLVAVVAATVLVKLLEIPVETIGSRFGEVPNTLPAPRVPAIDLTLVRELIQPATAIAILAGIESLLSAVIADGMTGDRHDSNTELVAQGVANLASPLFGGLPVTGALARTATNIKSGATSPVAGIVHALALLGILMVFGPWAAIVPLPTLAAILVVVAWNMGEWHLLRGLLRSPRSDVVVLVTAFLLTVLVDITVAIEVGVVMAALLFMRRMAEVAEVSPGVTDDDSERAPSGASSAEVPEGVEVYELQGAFFFGAADKFRDALNVVGRRPKVLVLRMRAVPAIDSTGLRALGDIADTSRRDGTTLVLSGVRSQPLRTLERTGLISRIGRENVCADFDAALARAKDVLANVSDRPRPSAGRPQ